MDFLFTTFPTTKISAHFLKKSLQCWGKWYRIDMKVVQSVSKWWHVENFKSI